MKILIKVVPRAKRNLVKNENDQWKVYVCAPAREGKANAAVINVLAEHFRLKRSKIEVTKGLHSRIKEITIKGDFAL